MRVSHPKLVVSQSASWWQHSISQSFWTISHLTLQKPVAEMYTHGKATLDYILTRRRHVSALRDYKTIHPPVFSDHRLLAVAFAVKWKVRESKGNVFHPDFDALQDPTTCATFVQSIESPVTITSLASAMQKLPAVQKRATITPTWYQDYVGDLIKCKAKLRCDEDAILQALDAAKVEQLNKCVLSFAGTLRQSPKKAWEVLRVPLRERMHAKFPAANEEERTQKLRNHFSSLLSSPGCQRPEENIVRRLFPFRNVSPVFKTGQFSEEELNNAVQTLPNGKSPGRDGVTNEVLKIPQLRQHVLRIVNELQAEASDAAKTSDFVPLPKKGDLSVPGNWRGITLEPHITKLYNKLNQMRLANALDKYLLCEQAGFREGRSTREHIICHALLVSDARRFKGRALYGAYIDLAKAFDSVPRWAIVEALRSLHTPESTISQIMSIIIGHRVKLRTDDVCEPIPVNIGVLQGDTLSPFLFIIVVDSLLRLLYDSEGVKSPHSKLQCDIKFLVYADDMLIVGLKPLDVQQMFLKFEAATTALGMKINYGKGKTEAFEVCKETDEHLLMKNAAGETIPLVHSYKYLGSHVLDQDADFAVAKGKAWAALRKLSYVWKASIPAESKRSLFQALIEPILSYPMCAYTLDARTKEKLDSAYSAMLRYALGLKCAYLSREFMHTEELFAALPFLSTQLRVRRASRYTRGGQLDWQRLRLRTSLVWFGLVLSDLGIVPAGQKILAETTRAFSAVAGQNPPNCSVELYLDGIADIILTTEQREILEKHKSNILPRDCFIIAAALAKTIPAQERQTGLADAAKGAVDTAKAL